MAITRREEAEAIEQFGDDLLKLCRDFCAGFDNRTVDRVCAVPNQEHLETIGKAFQALGRTMQDECDEACPAYPQPPKGEDPDDRTDPC